MDLSTIFSDLESQNTVQQSVIKIFRAFAEDSDDKTREEVLECIREEVAPSLLCHYDVVIYYEIYKKIRLFLEAKGIQCTQVPESGKLIARRVICAIWSGDEYKDDRELALMLFDNCRKGNAVVPGVQPPSPTSSNSNDAFASTNTKNSSISKNTEDYENKVAGFIAQRYRSKFLLFSGDLEEDWSQFLVRYQKICSEAKASLTQKGEYLHHALRGYALQFYYRNVVDKNETNWNNITTLFNNTFSSHDKMQRMSDRLEMMHVSQYESQGMSECAALDKMMKEVERVSPMAMNSSRGDDNMKNTLAKATLGKQYALLVTGGADYHNLTYMQTKVAYARAQQRLECHQNYKSTVSGASGTSSTRPNRWSSKETLFTVEEAGTDSDDDDAAINFTGQGRLGRHPKQLRGQNGTIGYKAHSSSNSNRTLSKFGCFNCLSKDHSLRNCNRQFDFEAIAKNKAAYFNAKKGASGTNVTEAMVELANEFKEIFNSKNISTNEDEDDEGEALFASSEPATHTIFRQLSSNSKKHRTHHTPSLTDALLSVDGAMGREQHF